MPLGAKLASGHFGDVYTVNHEYILQAQSLAPPPLLQHGAGGLIELTPRTMAPVRVKLVCKKMKQIDRLELFETECEIALELSRYVTENEHTIHVLLATRTPMIDDSDNDTPEKSAKLDAYWEFERCLLHQLIEAETSLALKALRDKNNHDILSGKKPKGGNNYSDRDLLAYTQQIANNVMRLDQHRLYIEEACGTLYHIFQPDEFRRVFHREITDEDWFGVLYSKCHTLAVLQNVCEFHHNDDHTMNSFIVLLRENQRWGKTRVTRRASDGRLHVSLAYRVGDQQLTLTHVDYMVKIGDFSLAETAKNKNTSVQKGKYEFYGVDGKQTRFGYDWQVFLLSVYSMRNRLKLSVSVRNWVKDALDAMEFDWRSLLKRQIDYELAFCLPTMNQVTKLTPADFLTNPDLSFPIELMRTNGYRAIMPRNMMTRTLTTTNNQDSLLLARSQDQESQRKYEYTHQEDNQYTRKYRSGRSIKCINTSNTPSGGNRIGIGGSTRT